MTMTNGVYGTSTANVGAAYLTTSATVSPEAFLAMLKNRLGNFDSQIDSIREAMDGRFDEQSALTDTKRKLENLRRVALQRPGDEDDQSGVGNGDEITTSDGRKMCIGAWLALPENEDVRRALPNANGNEVLTTDIDAAMNGIDEQLNQLKRNDEIEMVTLQSLIQERGSSIQLVSNLIANMNETTKGIIANMR